MPYELSEHPFPGATGSIPERTLSCLFEFRRPTYHTQFSRNNVRNAYLSWIGTSVERLSMSIDVCSVVDVDDSNGVSFKTDLVHDSIGGDSR